jgi:hypothetical protein
MRQSLFAVRVPDSFVPVLPQELYLIPSYGYPDMGTNYPILQVSAIAIATRVVDIVTTFWDVLHQIASGTYELLPKAFSSSTARIDQSRNTENMAHLSGRNQSRGCPPHRRSSANHVIRQRQHSYASRVTQLQGYDKAVLSNFYAYF